MNSGAQPPEKQSEDGRGEEDRREPSLKGMVPMNKSQLSPTAPSTHDTAHPQGGPAAPAAVAPRQDAAARPPGWTAGRITALVIGALLALVSLGLLGSGGTALWASTQRGAAGYLTTGVHEFATSGSALATERIDFGPSGTSWLYSPALLGEFRIRVTPVTPGPALFVGIGPSAAVDRYLTGVGRTLISDFWTNRVQAFSGGTPGSAPATQGFWAASATGTGPQTLRWDPANGSWTVVVMNADGRAGIHVRADLGAAMPALPWVAAGLLAAGAIFAAGAALLITGAIRRRRASGPGTA